MVLSGEGEVTPGTLPQKSFFSNFEGFFKVARLNFLGGIPPKFEH